MSAVYPSPSKLHYSASMPRIGTITLRDAESRRAPKDTPSSPRPATRHQRMPSRSRLTYGFSTVAPTVPIFKAGSEAIGRSGGNDQSVQSGAAYPAWSERTPSQHPRRQLPDFFTVELMRLNPLHLFFTGFLPPFFGAVLSIAVALVMHNDEISNYNWQCGRAKLPSLSRIINLPMERIFWQFTFLFHIPLRIVELAVGFNRYGRLRSVATRFPRFYTLNRYLYAILGSLELVFLVALSVVGEREFIGYHVVFFYAFGMFALGFYISNAVCHANSLYYLNPYGRISYRMKIVVAILYFISIPILLGAFLLYWRLCITLMYDVFAISEYLDVFLTIAYHCGAFFDIRYKVVFSVRRVKPVSKMQ